jgi:hypothetical protein
VVARLGPGSPEPGNPAEVEALLRMVPVVAFMSELDALVPAPLGSAPLTPAALTKALAEATEATETTETTEATAATEAADATPAAHSADATPATPPAHAADAVHAAHAADAAWLRRVVEALQALQARAEAQADGGLRFLAGTLRHFLEVERIPAAEHPLVVALFARTDARRRGAPDHPSEVARVLDGW